ncbi:MAG: hypothetical protein ACTH8F_07520 [Microbacterium sp.]|uniref:hypothetical protein n=1 Tax=Microbacterium sp. TaxID=51671 RepID=UPI003F9A7593
MNTEKEQSVCEFVDTWTGDLAAELATRLTCPEIDALARVLHSHNRSAAAVEWIRRHSEADEEGDAHYRSPLELLHADLEEIAAEVEGVELREEDPDSFGAGQLVFYKNHSAQRLALTEICDRPSTDESRTITGYVWHTDLWENGAWHPGRSGRISIERCALFPAAAREWATA